MPLPAWMISQQAERARTADVLASAADQMNLCRTIADTLHAQGREHHNNPTHQAAVIESHRLNRLAEAEGFDVHAVADEAARRQQHASNASGAIHTD